MNKTSIYRALRIAVIVGTILNVINNHEIVEYQNADSDLIIKVLLTYCVPFCVSLYSSWKATKE